MNNYIRHKSNDCSIKALTSAKQLLSYTREPYKAYISVFHKTPEEGAYAAWR